MFYWTPSISVIEGDLFVSSGIIASPFVSSRFVAVCCFILYYLPSVSLAPESADKKVSSSFVPSRSSYLIEFYEEPNSPRSVSANIAVSKSSSSSSLCILEVNVLCCNRFSRSSLISLFISSK